MAHHFCQSLAQTKIYVAYIIVVDLVLLSVVFLDSLLLLAVFSLHQTLRGWPPMIRKLKERVDI